MDEASVSTEIFNTKDFNAVLLDQESIKKLNTLLIPTNPLARDVRTLADILGFSNTDISYIVHKPYPFLYMYDQWIKRHQQSAKLSTLYKALTEIMRKDAAEIVQNAIKALDEQDPKEVMHIEERYFATMQRSISCATLAMADFSSSNVCERKRNGSTGGNTIPSLLKPKAPLKDSDSVAPDVLVVYYRDNDEHNKFISKFVKRCRRYGIDATDMFDPTSAEDRGFYIYSRLVEAQFVFVVCSEGFFQNSEAMLQRTPIIDEGEKEITFIMKFILNDIYDQAGNNPKFIPVLFPHGKEDYVPSVLKCSTIYKMPIDFDNLRRRVFGIEKYKLAPLPKTRPKITPKVIGAKKGFFK